MGERELAARGQAFEFGVPMLGFMCLFVRKRTADENDPESPPGPSEQAPGAHRTRRSGAGSRRRKIRDDRTDSGASSDAEKTDISYVSLLSHLLYIVV